MTIKQIQTATACVFNMSLHELLNGTVYSIHSKARHIAMYICRKQMGKPLSLIAEKFKCNHTSVIYAVEKVNKLLQDDKSMNKTIEMINNQIENKKIKIKSDPTTYEKLVKQTDITEQILNDAVIVSKFIQFDKIPTLNDLNTLVNDYDVKGEVQLFSTYSGKCGVEITVFPDNLTHFVVHTQII